MTKRSKTALVTGGAGYIGSHCVACLHNAGWDVVVLDDLSMGHADAVINGKLIVGNIGDREILDHVFSSYSINAVLHFAAYAYVGESVADPAKYYHNNISNGLALLEAMIRHDVLNLVFSSTCAVYGEPNEIPIHEEHPKAPINPYGYTKMVFEQMALDMARSSGLRPVFLRYFNAAGADPDGRFGEDHSPETHLIPLVIDAALGKREAVSIFGADYPTPDGTCIRDYIHIIDLVDAHIKALDYLAQGGEPAAFNLGNGNGYSVKQVIDTVARASGMRVPVVEAARREGDPAILIGSADKAKKVLGWRPRFPKLEPIVETAFHWRRSHPDGYEIK